MFAAVGIRTASHRSLYWELPNTVCYNDGGREIMVHVSTLLCEFSEYDINDMYS